MGAMRYTVTAFWVLALVAAAAVIQHNGWVPIHGIKIPVFLLAIFIAGWRFGIVAAALAALLSLAAIALFWLDALQLVWLPVLALLGLSVAVVWVIARQCEVERSREDERGVLHTIVDRIPAFIAYLDPDRRYRFHNRLYDEWFPDRAIDGARLDDVHSTEVVAALRPYIDRAYAGEQVRVASTLQGPTGARRFDVLYFPHRRDGDTATGVVVYAHDVTDLASARRLQHEAEARLGALVLASGGMVWRADIAGMLPSPAWTSFTGRDPSEYVGDGWLRSVHPKDRAEVEAFWLQRLHDDGPRECRCSLRAADGAHREVVITCAPVVDEDGQRCEWLGTIRDVALTPEAQQQLRSRDAAQRELLANMAQIVWLADANGTVTYQNARWYAYTGLTEGDHWSLVTHADDIEHANAMWHSAVASGEPSEVEQRFLRAKDSSYRWHVVRCVPVRDVLGHVQRWITTCTDIEDQKRALKVLASANERTSRFIATMSHELRNPLAGIAAVTEVLQREQAQQDDRERALRTLSRQTEHLRLMVDELLDVSRITRGVVEISRNVVDLGKIVKDACDDMALVAAEKGVSIDCQESGSYIVSGDALRLHQAFENLLSNAVKASAPGQVVRVMKVCIDDKARVSVVDEGIGLSSDSLETIFEPFVQAGSGHRQGLGLGLAIARKLVEAHGGEITASSPGLGRGARFDMTLPLSTRQAAPLEVVHPARRVEGRVLLVDDEVENTEALALLLGLEGLTVEVASDPEIAMSRWTESGHDVVICDIDLGGPLDGHDLARALSSQNPRPYLIAYTGYGRPEDVQRSRLAGFNLHLTKPSQPRRLLEAIIEGLDSTRGGGVA